MVTNNQHKYGYINWNLNYKKKNEISLVFNKFKYKQNQRKLFLKKI